MATTLTLSSTIGIIAQLCTYLIFIACIILSIHGNKKIYQIRNAIFIQKRSINIYFGLNISLIIAIVAIINGYIARIISTINTQSGSNSVYIVIADNISIICYYLFLFFCITKSWMIYYKERWTFHTLQSQWINIITSNDDSTTNWFIRNNHKYGSLSYMTKIFGIYHIIAAILGTVAVIGLHLGFIDKSITDILAALPFLISIVIYTIIICKTTRLSEVDDVFYIHWESKIHSRILLLFLIAYLAQAVLQTMLEDILTTMIFTPIFIIITYSIHHFSTYLVYNKNFPQNFRPQLKGDTSFTVPTVSTNTPDIHSGTATSSGLSTYCIQLNLA